MSLKHLLLSTVNITFKKGYLQERIPIIKIAKSLANRFRIKYFEKTYNRYKSQILQSSKRLFTEDSSGATLGLLFLNFHICVKILLK